MIGSLSEFVDRVDADFRKWNTKIKPWFRGESDSKTELCPKIASYTEIEENYFMQTFRRRAGGLANTPHRHETDMWLFLAQHYGVPTRLLDWTEGALMALYFAVNEYDKPTHAPKVYMLNPQRLNQFAWRNCSYSIDYMEFLLTWSPDGSKPNIGYENISLAWNKRDKSCGVEMPYAIPATYNDMRMLSQKSCFTVHGKKLIPMMSILDEEKAPIGEILIKYEIKPDCSEEIVKQLSVMGMTATTIFPELSSLAKDMVIDAKLRSLGLKWPS